MIRHFTDWQGSSFDLVEPYTESDPVALLVQFLSATGNIIGANAHFRVEADKHYLKINPILVGETSKGRKGTSLGYVKSLYEISGPRLGVGAIIVWWSFIWRGS